jgi:tetratricopeptide (TPR) repeat protein
MKQQKIFFLIMLFLTMTSYAQVDPCSKSSTDGGDPYGLLDYSILSPIQSSITTGNGWSLQDNGTWASSPQRIPYTDSRTNTSRQPGIDELGLGNYISIELRKIMIKDEQFNVLIHRYKDGEYEFPYLKKGWVGFESFDFYVFRSQKLAELLPENVPFNVPYIVDLECFATGKVKNYEKLIYKDKNLALKSHATGVINSFAQNKIRMEDVHIIKEVQEMVARRKVNDGNLLMAVYPIRSGGEQVVRFKMIPANRNQNLIRIQTSPDNWYDLFDFQFYEVNYNTYERFIRDSQQYFIDFDAPSDQYTSHYNWGLLRYQIGDYDGAERAFSLALQENPNTTDFMIYALRGNALSKMGYYCDAILDYDRAINLKPTKVADYANWIKNYFNRGVAKYYIGNNTGSCEDWTKAYDLGYGSADEFLYKYCNRRINQTVSR